MEKLLQAAMTAPRGSVAQQAAIKAVAELFNQQEEKINKIDAFLFDNEKGE